MIKKFLDFGFYKINCLALIALVLCFLYVKIFHISEIYENTLFENLAIIPLVISIFLCLKAKTHKVFFRTIAMIIFLIIAREFNYGRVIFCQLPDNPHDFYPWSHYKYGWLAHVIVGLYIAFGAIYALVNKIWLEIIDVIQKVKFPFWSFLSSFVLVIIQLYFEKIGHSSIIEEAAEFALYCLVLALCVIYTNKLKEK